MNVDIKYPKLYKGLLLYTRVYGNDNNNKFSIVPASIIFHKIDAWQDAEGFIKDDKDNTHPLSYLITNNGQSITCVGSKTNIDALYFKAEEFVRLGIERE